MINSEIKNDNNIKENYKEIT